MRKLTRSGSHVEIVLLGAFLMGCAAQQDLGREVDASRVPVSIPRKAPLDLGDLFGRPLHVRDIESLPSGLTMDAIARRFGGGLPSELPVMHYPIAGQPGKTFVFWFMPQEPIRELRKWSLVELRCVTRGLKGEVLWPAAHRGGDVDDCYRNPVPR